MDELIKKDFKWIKDSKGYEAINEEGKGYYKYVGEKSDVEIPHIINRHYMTSYYNMFKDNNLIELKIKSDNVNIIDMDSMFFRNKAKILDLSNFNTSNVINMHNMFGYSKTTLLDLSNFDTSNVVNMEYMFYKSKMTSLDLSNFDTSNVTSMNYMFNDSEITTCYVKAQADADRFNSIDNNPSSLIFIVK